MTPELPEPNTPAELEWFAREGMGWEPWPIEGPSKAKITTTYYLADHGSRMIERAASLQLSTGSYWNPRTSLADAVELADAVFPKYNAIRKHNLPPGSKVAFAFFGNAEPDTDKGVEGWGISRCKAICEAVREKLAQDGKVTDA